MWQDRFGFSYEKAAELVSITKSTKNPISSSATRQAMLSPAQASIIYALKLERPFATPQEVQKAARLSKLPQIYHGAGEEGDATFCKIDGQTKQCLENWLSKEKSTFRPLFVPEGKAYKELSDDSLYPTLGKDATLPQYRPQDPHLLDKCPSYLPSQHTFPVWYFFYGTLASVPKLRSLLGLSENETPVLHPGTVTGGRMKTWGKGKYNALVNGRETDCVQGSAFQVLSEEHEDSLRKYETSAYEVVRCLIEMEGSVEGCTFRFVGETD
ncbi:hypothetical protein HYALB_00000953 [Hymenoscyphus albidus]|uniref:Putative gamma-glutamylcyclotransferase n=1 Tax=Hymenoscyphus albidus TaxID=595503 RepID=A0A9N9M0Y5_9HELO|nr:hypothetical protein HYALB_00000953 [Hymenoscyphus albidus]